MSHQKLLIRLIWLYLQSGLFGQCKHPLSTLTKTKLDINRSNQISATATIITSSLLTAYSKPRQVLAAEYPQQQHYRHIPFKSTSDVTPNVVITDLLFIRHAESFNNIIYDSLMNDDSAYLSSDDDLIKKRRKLRQADCSLSKRGIKQVNLLQTFAQQGGIHQAVGIKISINNSNNNNNDNNNYDNYMPSSTTTDSNAKFSMSMSNWMIYSSPMKRCLLTSQALSIGLNKPVYVHPLLYEAGGCYDIVAQPQVTQSHQGEEVDGEPSTVARSGATAKEVEMEYTNYKCLPGMENGWYHDRSATNSMETNDEFQARVDTIVNWIWSVHEENRINRHAVTTATTASNTKPHHQPSSSEEYEYKKDRLFKSSPSSTSHVHHHSHTSATATTAATTSIDHTNDNSKIKKKNMILVCHGLLLSAILTKLQGGIGLITHYNTGYSHVQLVSPISAVNNDLNKAVITTNDTKGKADASTSSNSDNNNIDASSSSSLSPNAAASSTATRQTRFSTIKCINKCDHINVQTQYDLLTGADSWNDSWIQEYQRYSS